MQRYEDWEKRLDVFLRQQNGKQFKYGTFDCCLFVCDAIKAMTGVDPAETFRGIYATRTEGRKLLRMAGGIEGVAADYGLPEVDPLFARRGDVIMFRRSLIGLVAMNGMDALVIGDRGLTLIPVNTGIKAWNV